MSLWDRVRSALGLRTSTGDVAIEEDRVVLKDLERAKAFPQEPAEGGPAEMSACKRCGERVRKVVFTTAGSGAQLDVWRAYPFAMDGWLCVRCGWSAMPRWISAEESVEFGGNGDEHARAGRFDDAEFWLRRIVASWPKYPAGHADLGQLSMARADATRDHATKLRHRADAERWLRRAVEEDVDCRLLGIRVPLARVMALNGKEPEALQLLADLLADARLGGRHREDAEALVRELRAGRGLFSRATELVGDIVLEPPGTPLDGDGRRRLDCARTLLEEAKEREASFATLWYLGKVHLRSGRLDAALAALEQAHAADPDQPDGCRELDGVYLELDRAADALPIARRAVGLRPDDAGLLCNLGLVLLLTGDTENAKVTVDAALRADPSDQVTQALARMIADVVAGRRPRPRSLAEAEGRSRA